MSQVPKQYQTLLVVAIVSLAMPALIAPPSLPHPRQELASPPTRNTITITGKVFEASTRRPLASTIASSCGPPTAATTDPLPSSNDTFKKRSIIALLNRVTTAGTTDFIPPAERIATLDKDGTLWAEQPIYFQLPQTGKNAKV